MLWLTLSFALAAAVAAPQERLLLIEDPSVANFERTLVHQQLLINLMRDPTVQVIPHDRLPTQLLRSVALQEQADLLASTAKRHLHALNPEEAIKSAAAAVMRYNRVAVLTGDITGLTDALSINAAAHLLLGQQKEAVVALNRLLTLDPTFTPSPSLYNRSMQQRVREVAQKLNASPHQTVVLSASEQQSAGEQGPSNTTAIFVDGHFVGFGRHSVPLSKSTCHHLWLVPERGEPQGTMLCPSLANSSFESSYTVSLWPSAKPSPGSQATFGHILAASQLPAGQVDPFHPALQARRIDTVLVLAYAGGALRLTTFELRQGKRHSCQAAAVVTNLWDVTRIASALVSSPPLAAVPNGA